jgi:hypothetical protein
MTGKIVGVFIVLAALVGGAAIYWLQVYGFYEPVEVSGSTDVELTLLVTGEPEPILYEDFTAIDAESSPIRYRACFTTNLSEALLTETYEMVEHAEPRNAPEWFDCFDAKEIGRALEKGEALAFMGTENVIYGIDRLVAILPDGRGFVWHEINECGELAFDGKPLPAHCPAQPEE